MGMDDPSEDNKEDGRVLPPFPATPWRNCLAQHLALLRNVGCAFFSICAFAAIEGAPIGADMGITASVLFVGWLCIAVGWMLAPEISRTAEIVRIIISALPFILMGFGTYRDFHP
jgi:hypothetical protein